MKFKKITAALSLALLLGSFNVSAAQSTPGKHIPKYMAPGTTITFDKNSKVIILEKGEETAVNKNNITDIDESTLPLAKEGITVTYDALGQPIVLNKEARQNPKINVDVKKLDTKFTKMSAVSPSVASNSQTGKTSYYYASGKKGNSGTTLDQWSAAHMTLPYWTTVHDQSTENTGKSATVYVLDRGNFSYPLILDIDYTRFVTDFYPASKGLFWCKLTWYN